jgi:hypothetical protein
MSDAATPVPIQPLASGGPAHSLSGGLFSAPATIWGRSNLQFEHRVSEKSIVEVARGPHSDPLRFPVPAQSEQDFVTYAFGAMPQALTLRPHEASCCSGERKYDLARGMFADSIAEVTVDTSCLFHCGCADGAVSVTQKDKRNVLYTGAFSKSLCAGCFDNTLKLQWSGTKSKPYMSYRSRACCDALRSCFCMEVWTGWRGSSETAPQDQVLFDSSTSSVGSCRGCCRSSTAVCCKKNHYDFAPRWVDPEEIAGLVRGKYDYQFAHRTLEQVHPDDEETRLLLAPVGGELQKVDLLLASRLYEDEDRCGLTVRFANKLEINKGLLAAIDARYRGSVDHANPSEDDHLIALAAAIMHGYFTFPNTANMPYADTPSVKHSGRVLPRA